MGLRLRLFALVGLISLPLVALVVHVTLDDYERAEARSRRQIQRLVATVVHQEAEIVERARHLMTALAELPVVRERRHDACAVLLARLLAEYKVYATLGVTSADGQVVCSAPAAPPGTTLADRPIFARARAAGGFIVGEYAVGRLSGKPSLGLGFAVNDANGQLQALVFGSLDLGWLPELLARVELMAGTTVTLLDRNGVVFARLPHAERWVGRNVRDSAIVRALGDRQRVTEALADLDGRARIFAISRLESAPTAIVAVGLDRDAARGVIYGDIARTAGAVGFTVLLVLAMTWFGATALLVRPLRRVIAATQRFAKGDLGSRVGGETGGGELAELGRAFDDMAATIATRTRQAELAERRYRGLFQRNLAGMFRTREGRFVDCNAAFARIFGYRSPEEVMERRTAELYAAPEDQRRILDDLAGGGPITREIRGRQKDGSEVWILLQVVEARTETATFREGMAIDITDRRAGEAEAREAAALREVAALAAAAAHEINNPLTVVQGHLYLIGEHIGEEHRLQGIRDAVKRITEIVARMTRITRLRHDDFSPATPMLDIRESSDPDDPAPR